VAALLPEQRDLLPAGLTIHELKHRISVIGDDQSWQDFAGEVRGAFQRALSPPAPMDLEANPGQYSSSFPPRSLVW